MNVQLVRILIVQLNIIRLLNKLVMMRVLMVDIKQLIMEIIFANYACHLVQHVRLQLRLA